jgi:hypothetical protein
VKTLKKALVTTPNGIVDLSSLTVSLNMAFQVDPVEQTFELTIDDASKVSEKLTPGMTIAVGYEYNCLEGGVIEKIIPVTIESPADFYGKTPKKYAVITGELNPLDFLHNLCFLFVVVDASNEVES